MPLYSLLLFLVLLVGAPFWLVRMATSGRYRSGLSQRLGRVPAGLAETIAGRPVIWLHAVSVGEVLTAAELIAGLERAYPEYAVAISTTTEAGQRLARQRFPGHAVFYMPLDFAVLVRRILRVLRPRLVLLLESELWPNLIRESDRNGAAIVVVNARISDRSFPRYLRLRRLWRPILRPVSLFLAQGEETAARLRAIGIPEAKIQVTGNLKYDVRSAPQGEVFSALRDALPAGSPLLVAGSTLEDEEAQLLDAWPKVLRALPMASLLLAPRHTPRFDAVVALAESRGFTVHRASRLSPAVVIARGEVIVLDTIGDLAGVYALGRAALVGGSLVPAGGHNPLEPARFGVPVILGSSFENFREIVTMMQASAAIRVLQPGERLAEILVEALSGGPEMRALGERGRAMFLSQAGATERAVVAITALGALTALAALAPLAGGTEGQRLGVENHSQSTERSA